MRGEAENKRRWAQVPFAKGSERNRRIWRIVFLVLGICALAGIIKEVLSGIHLRQFKEAIESSVSIIGGADGPTAIFLSNMLFRKISLLIRIAVGVIAAIGLWRTRRRS